jgi:Cys-tRNA(Pro) deacylase
MHPADRSDPKVATVIAAAAAHGVHIEPVSFDEETRTSAEAARAVGCGIERICKSLVFEADGEPVLLLLSGADRVDLARAAQAVGVTRLDKADAERAKRRSGFSIGATPPFGHDEPFSVFVDERLAALDKVWAAGGRPDTVFEISTADLIAISGAAQAALHETKQT